MAQTRHFLSEIMTAAQEKAAERIAAFHGDGVTFSVERDESHDEHVFVCFYDGGSFLEEVVIEADGAAA